MIKVTYNTFGEGTSKPEKTIISIHDGRIFVQYNVPNKAEATVKQMLKDGRTGVLFSRGCLIQNFSGKNEKEILEIVKKDIENGLYVAEKKSGKKLEIKDLVIEEK